VIATGRKVTDSSRWEWIESRVAVDIEKHRVGKSTRRHRVGKLAALRPHLHNRVKAAPFTNISSSPS
jgi:hypothetical protein